MSKFPIILYPKPIEEFIKSQEAENNKIPRLPSSPVLKNAASLPSVNEVSSPSLLKLCLLGNFILSIGAILLNNLPLWLLVLLFLSCNYILLFSWKKLSIGQFYRKSLFDEDSSQLKQYEKQLKAHKRLSTERIKRQQQYDKTITVYRKELQTKLKQSLLPTSYSTAQQGASEGWFRRYLDKYFPNYIHQGFEVIIPNSKFSYSTDFTYIDKYLNLYVDIEIDEPYYYKTKEPTHCSDQEKDKHRNAFFRENNWVVIRFAEEQVVCYPNRCCKLIAKVVAEITGNWEIFNKFKEVSELPTLKQWSIKEAHRMAKSNYRDKYLCQLNKVKTINN